MAKSKRKLVAARRRRLVIFLFGLIAFFTVVGIGGSVFLKNNTEIEMSLNGSEIVAVEYNHVYAEEGANATFQFLSFKPHKLGITIEGSVDASVLGEQIITYKASALFKTKTITRTIRVIDSYAPTITLTEQTTLTMPGEAYVEDGYVATDNYDGDLTNQVTREEADGKVNYTVTDSSGNQATVTREIKYADVTPPVITLSGESTMTITQGTAYSEPGYSAADDRDGDLTASVAVEGGVDSNTIGTYTITYSVADSSGNTASVTRTVTVNQVAVNNEANAASGNKIVYLTFDDGPGAYTQQLLNVLAKYNVKATFFVTAQYPGYLNLIASEVAAGHSVGIHSYSHNYQSIYSSVDNFYADFNKMASIIQQYGGITTNISRFPGGSSNAVSKQYCTGIMTSLTQSVVAKGYQYFDWNVTSGDAGETTSTQQIVTNVTSGIAAHNVSVVLQHDVKDYSVAAVEQIIIWGLNNGYTFMPLTASSYAAHHGVNN